MKTTIQKIAFSIALLIYSLLGLSQDNEDPTYLYRTGIKASLHSKILGEQRDIWVHLPDNGNLKPGVKYPVVYVLDGSVQMSALTTVYEYYWGNYLPKMILVGISNQSNRTRDLTTSKVNMGKMKTGGAEKFTRFIEEELIPYVDTSYPTAPFRTLIGHSYGGLFTINVLLNHSRLFNHYIAIDPSLDWDDQKFLRNALDKLEKENFPGKLLYLSLAAPLDKANEALGLEEVMEKGSEHSIFARSVIEFAQAAESTKQNMLNFSWRYYPDDIHGTVALPSILDGLREQFKWYQLKDASKYNDPGTSLQELKALITERENTLSEHFGYPAPPADEELLTMGGQMFMQTGQAEKAKLFFELGAEYYPESPGAREALAEFYHSQGDKTKTIEQLTKAYKLSKDEKYKHQIDELNAH